MKLLKVVFLAGVLNLVNAVYGQSERLHVSRFLSQFSQYRRTSSAQNPADGNKHLNVDGLKRTTRHDFKSRRPAPGERNTYLRFHLSVYEYKSPESAASAFDRLRREIVAEQDEVPHKSPLYVLLHGDKVYWLSGACLYSRANWDAIEAKLKQALLVETEPGGDKAIKFLCGGAVAGG